MFMQNPLTANQMLLYKYQCLLNQGLNNFNEAAFILKHIHNGIQIHKKTHIRMKTEDKISV